MQIESKNELYTLLKNEINNYAVYSSYPSNFKEDNILIITEEDNTDSRLAYKIDIYNNKKTDIKTIGKIADLFRRFNFIRTNANEVTDSNYKHYVMRFRVDLPFSLINFK